MRGTFARITLGDLFYKLPGFVNNVSLSWDIAYPWEIDSDSLRVPHILNVDVSYTPIHDNPPTTTTNFLTNLREEEVAGRAIDVMI